MDIPPSGSKPHWNKENPERPEQESSEISVTPHLRASLRESSPDKRPVDSGLSERQISHPPATENPGSVRTWSNHEPLVRLSPDLDKSPPVPGGWRCSWKFQRDISELALRPSIRKEAIQYINLDTEQRVRWLDERMTAQTYRGTEFPGLCGQLEVRAGKDIKAFEILGHYAGEINAESSLTKLKEIHGSTAVSEYLVEARQGYSVSALKHGNVCSLINANQLHVDKLDPQNPVVKTLDTTVVPANTALMPVSYQGKIITFVISIAPIPKGQSLWLDYGADYWIDRFKHDSSVTVEGQEDRHVSPDSLTDDLILADAAAEAYEAEMDWQPETAGESDSDEEFSPEERPSAAKKVKLAGSRPKRLAAQKSTQAGYLPLSPEQAATSVDQLFEEKSYQLKMRDNSPLLCNRHAVSAGQRLGTVKARACYVTQFPSGKMVAFQDWYGKPVLMDSSEPVVLLGALVHSPATPGEAAVYQGFILEGCHRFLSKSSTGYNCEIELFDPDNPEREIEPDENPAYGKEFALRLVSTQNLPAGTPLIRPAGLFPAFTPDIIDSEEEVVLLKKACTHAMQSQITEPLPAVWTQTEFPSLESLARNLPAADSETMTLVKHLDAQQNDKYSITRLLIKSKSHPEFVPLFVLASLKIYAPITQDAISNITRRLDRNKIRHPVTGITQWVSADTFDLADTMGLIPRKMRYQSMPTQWLKNACLAGRWLELAGYFQHLLNTGCPSRNILSILFQNGVPVPEFLEPNTEWRINNLIQVIKTFGINVPAQALGQHDKWRSKRLSGNQGVIDTALEHISKDTTLPDVRVLFKKTDIPALIAGERICPVDIGELITIFKTEETVSEDDKKRFFTWLDQQLFLTVQAKGTSAALNLVMQKRLNRDMLLHFIYAKARHGTEARKLLDRLKQNKTPQPVEKDSSIINNQWKGVGQYEFFQYLIELGELGKTTARILYKSQTKVFKRKLAEKYPWITQQDPD